MTDQAYYGAVEVEEVVVFMAVLVDVEFDPFWLKRVPISPIINRAIKIVAIGCLANHIFSLSALMDFCSSSLDG